MSARLSASAISLTYDAIPYSQKAKLSGFVLFSFSLTRLRYDTIPKQGAVRFTTTVLGRYSYSKTLNERHKKKQQQPHDVAHPIINLGMVNGYPLPIHYLIFLN